MSLKFKILNVMSYQFKILKVMRRLMTVFRRILEFYEYTKDFLLPITAILVFCYCVHPARFASHYSYIKTENIIRELEQAYSPKNNACSFNVFGRKNLQLIYPDENFKEKPTLLAYKLDVLPGGQWKPTKCQSLYNIAIILPFRNRWKQLTIFMNYIHPFLQSQNLNYMIFVIEQSSSKEFNRAKLFNIGFAEAIKINNFHCFIFQDIDLIPQNPKNIYACTKMPRHMSSSVNTFRYNLPYIGLFGGAIALTRQQFEKVNGFSNLFFGWGGEDDDFYTRLLSKGFVVTRFSPDIAQYYMLTHKKEIPNSARFINLKNGVNRFDADGISNLQYKVLNHQLQPLYSWILVDI